MKPTLVFIDLRELFRQFQPSPFCLVSAYYHQHPMLYRVIEGIGLMTIFKLTYLSSSDSLAGDSAIWEYLDATDSPWYEIITSDNDLLMLFDHFLEIFMFEADRYLLDRLTQAEIYAGQEFLFENGYDSSTVLMIADGR